MKALALSLAALLLAGPAAAQGAGVAAVRDTSLIDQTGARILRQTVHIAAPPSAVWKALTDQASYRAWVAPVSFIDFRVGGAVEVSFDAKGRAGDPGNLKQAITAYLPERLIVFRNVGNTGVPGGAVYGNLAIVLELSPAPGGGTDVSLAQVGYRTGPDYDALYSFFRAHNPEFLADLKAYAEKTR